MTNNSAMTRRIRSCRSSSLVPFVKLSTVIDNLDAWLVQGEGSFEPYPNEHDLSKKHVRFIRKLQWESCSTNHSYFFSNNFTNLGASAKPFPTKLKPSKCPAKGEKWGKKKRSGKEWAKFFLLRGCIFLCSVDHTLYLPFQHSKLLQWFTLVSVSVICDKGLLTVQGPALSKRCIISLHVQPRKSILTVVTEVLRVPLDLKDKNKKDTLWDRRPVGSVGLAPIRREGNPGLSPCRTTNRSLKKYWQDHWRWLWLMSSP